MQTQGSSVGSTIQTHPTTSESHALEIRKNVFGSWHLQHYLGRKNTSGLDLWASLQNRRLGRAVQFLYRAL